MPLLALCMALLAAAQPSVPTGTPVEAKLESQVHTGSSKVGDEVIAVLTDPIRSAGTVVVPEGSRLNGRVETVQAATRSNEGRVRLVFREIEFRDGRRVSTWITDSFAAATAKRNRRHLIYMAVGGSLGAWIGGKTARVAGILGGTLTGFVLAANSGDTKLRDLTLERGKTLRLELGQDLTLQ
jgi:hypothetical protein